jgi:hypothetical protein
MYFQWQNKFLLKTIYPRRNRKLADFLIYCQEIDVWEQYKNKDVANLGAEVDAYIANRENAVITAYKSYKTEYSYFTNEEMCKWYLGKYKLTDEAELAPIKELHRAFLQNLPKRQDVRREKNFVAYYLTVWQERVRKLKEEQKRLERRLEIILPDHRDRPALTQQLQKLREVSLPMLNEELQRLVKFLSTYNKIEKRKLEFYNATESAKGAVQGLRVKLDGLRTPLQRLETECRELSTAVARIKTPPKREALDGYFATEDVQDEICRDFPEADPSLVNGISSVHKRLALELRSLQSEDVKRIRLKNYVDELRGQQSSILSEVSRLESQARGASGGSVLTGEKQARLTMLKGAGLRAVEAELDKLSNYHAAYEYANKPQAERSKLSEQKEKELQKKQASLSQLEEQASAVEKDLQAKESILNMSEVDYLVRFVPEKPISVSDIVRGKIEAYKAALEERMDEKRSDEEIQQEFLEEIVQRFIEKPGEYPLWLQYMVIHFSGMRYATAHGSWADPKELLSNLRTSELEKVFKTWDDDTVEAVSEERLDAYESPNPATAPRLALATDQKSKDKVAIYLSRLKLPYRRRDALFELLVAEENYEIQAMDPAEALEELKARRGPLPDEIKASKIKLTIAAQALQELDSEKDAIPDWMWKEITRLTDLRVQEAKDDSWNKLSTEEQDQKNEARYAKFREIMNKWKQDNLTGWREEHDRSNRLIVASSVCNEVAEQILHLRGHSPAGGLTGIVDWYLRLVREAKVPGTPRPYFVFAKEGAEQSYREGATILWLRFVNEVPNAWRVAKPLAVNGDRLIPDKYRRTEGKPDEWMYSEGDVITRKRTRTVDKRLVKDQQWLRWMHAATVAKVADTADGKMVLTFETALPYDDPTVSAVGVFKHDLRNLMWDGGEDNYFGSFIGYLPDGEIPAGDLEDMLDWNHILRRQVMPPAQLAEYQKKYIRMS